MKQRDNETFMALNVINAKSMIFFISFSSENTLQNEPISSWSWNSCTWQQQILDPLFWHSSLQTQSFSFNVLLFQSWCVHARKNILFHNKWSSVEMAQTDRCRWLFFPASDSVSTEHSDIASLWLTSRTLPGFIHLFYTSIANTEAVADVFYGTHIYEWIIRMLSSRKLNHFTCYLIPVKWCLFVWGHSIFILK